MSTGWVLLIVVAIALAGGIVGYMRSRSLGDGSKLHSRPSYYGAYVALCAFLPAVVLIILVNVVTPMLADAAVRSTFPPEVANDPAQSNLTAGVVSAIAGALPQLTAQELEQLRIGVVAPRALFAEKGVAIAAEVRPFMIAAAEAQNAYIGWGNTIRVAGGAILAVAGALFGLARVAPQMRARNAVETAVRYILILASSIAILTTFGIVMSLVWESLVFFSEISPIDFFFGTVWDPRFAAAGAEGQHGRYGLLPLLWGTLYISLIALLIAVPIGLFAAIYLSEYATKRVRSLAKPALEVLAGIPTIVYGFFALTTMGPLIRDFIAVPLQLGTSASSVMTAGVTMGIMIIPFVSSLSDDIINAVPQSLRDGSYALGATKSETIRQVLLPAALPGIVGAVLLAASRAIGETMIVVLAAGVASRISLNPFQEMTTMTVRIVSQLTGDTAFTSPETLVAFALGLTLFTVTLILNIYALHIVRKYREQYD
jgi:phosphate transport system permease protein